MILNFSTMDSMQFYSLIFHIYPNEKNSLNKINPQSRKTVSEGIPTAFSCYLKARRSRLWPIFTCEVRRRSI